jgi:Na+/melibiose symporter-like transporter
MRLRLMYAIVPAVLLFGAAITAAFYPISEARLRDIRAHLDERRRDNPGLSDSPEIQ